ncbi:Gfo/Idh/MocA family oxidoreductase [Pedobacter heparinus]|uniref:Alpha-N-acetylgalactosaminidase n=1 Tax=Pedobacter heparinus (strain ATCC 13125 / DSM 2366 / CIP 104194 / JCM 7457 / NBRC 12017 / NCIMB 9290 / NRRL B-14731 / HIM 762-3) TaxID=485917 RepID=C6XSF7_PEDHD|nr:Gfo/Idh/MocA family oxidoreductase [Pedobacter heparinus]ACU03502.1 Alpha-N-acetylgalactosaminidase [Pedobacter heparinus DSM 2366]
MNNRRDFLKLTSIAGAGLLAGCATRNASAGTGIKMHNRNYTQKFNMSGYAAPKLQTVRVGFIGVGNRGTSAVTRMSKIEGVEIKAICDLRPEKAQAAKRNIANTPHRPDLYTGGENEWKKMCERNDIDLVYIATPWNLHTPMAVFSMEHDKHAAVEVPAAETLEECWQLVETSEKTKKHCMMLENCCYDFFELLTLNMARQGFFGEIVHAEGAYLHDLLDENFSKTQYQGMWRLKDNYKSGNLYPTHGLGPVAQAMDINRGDKMDYLVSVSSNDFMMAAKANELAAKDDFYKEFAGKSFRGNMNVTTIRTSKGKTIMIQHDVTSPRPYSRLHTISGTKAIAQKYPLPARIATNHLNWVTPEEMKVLEERYQPAIVKKIGEMAKKVGGHGGMDFMMDWRLIDCLRNGLPLDMDVYDAATWSSIKPLSEISVANRSNSIDVPDFTGGSWKTNKQVDLTLSHLK